MLETSAALQDTIAFVSDCDDTVCAQSLSTSSRISGEQDPGFGIICPILMIGIGGTLTMDVIPNPNITSGGGYTYDGYFCWCHPVYDSI
jgi:hypothetical protein